MDKAERHCNKPVEMLETAPMHSSSALTIGTNEPVRQRQREKAESTWSSKSRPIFPSHKSEPFFPYKRGHEDNTQLCFN